jgi:hypothetical protein
MVLRSFMKSRVSLRVCHFYPRRKSKKEHEARSEGRRQRIRAATSRILSQLVREKRQGNFTADLWLERTAALTGTRTESTL